VQNIDSKGARVDFIENITILTRVTHYTCPQSHQLYPSLANSSRRMQSSARVRQVLMTRNQHLQPILPPSIFEPTKPFIPMPRYPATIRDTVPCVASQSRSRCTAAYTFQPEFTNPSNYIIHCTSYMVYEVLGHCFSIKPYLSAIPI
jgi:hypothetical protein